MSRKRICKNGLQGKFDNKGMRYTTPENKTMIEAKIKDGLYIVDYIADNYNELAFQGAKDKQLVLISQLKETKKVLDRYTLYHRRFSYLGLRRLYYLHERITLKDKLVILRKRGIYSIYKLTKIRNIILKRLAKYKTISLERIYLDICKLLLISL